MNKTPAHHLKQHTEQHSQQHANSSPRTRIIIFAKYPQAGKAKTRLQPALGAIGSEQMARKLLLHTISQALATGFTVELCVSPPPSDACWQQLDLVNGLTHQLSGHLADVNSANVLGSDSIGSCNSIKSLDRLQWSEQATGDLGERMATASEQALTKAEQVLLIGTDCPDLSSEKLQQASASLACHDAVLIPAYDGGYVLLGLKQVDRQIFTGIVWSTATVAQLTRQKINALDWSLQIFEPLHDIDEPEDLQYLPKGW